MPKKGGEPRKRPVTRDLTNSFVQQRKRSLERSLERDPPPPEAYFSRLPGSDPLIDSDGAGPARAERASLPPQWVDFADKAKEEIRDIQSQLSQLTKAHQRKLQRPFTDDAEDREVEVVSSSIATLIRCCEQSIHQVRTYDAGPDGSSVRDEEFRHNMQRNLAAQLQQLSKRCREAQKEYLKEMQKRQAAAADPELGAAEGAANAGSGDDLEEPQLRLTTQATELDAMEELAARRSGHIAQIAASVNDLNIIFKDLANMVIDQGTILDRIDANTEKIYNKSDNARNQMQKAVVSKKRADSRAAKCFFLWAGLDLLALLILCGKYIHRWGIHAVLVMLGLALGIGLCVFLGCRYGPKAPDLSKVIPEGWNPQKLWKKVRPGPVNTMKAAAGMNRMGAGMMR